MTIDFTVRKASNGWIIQWYDNNEYERNKEFVATDVEALKTKVVELLTPVEQPVTLDGRAYANGSQQGQQIMAPPMPTFTF